MKILILLLSCIISFSVLAKDDLSDTQIKQRMIHESIASYPGNCPCPYNTARNGSRCGKRSAYSKPGGYAPLCYEEDITLRMIQDYRKRRNNEN